MPNYKVVDADQLDMGLTTVADSIREKTGGTEQLSFPDGMALEMDAVLEAGKQALRKQFWDRILQNGERTDYRFTESLNFSGQIWGPDNFYPTYDIVPVGNATRLFFAWNRSDHHNFDLAKRLEDCGVVLDTSKATYLSNAFAYGTFSHIPKIDFSAATEATGVFANMYSYLRTIDKIIVAESTPYDQWFVNTTFLENVIFEGVIGQNGLDVSSCTRLTHDSLMSIINALNDYSGSGQTYTVTLGATNLAKLTDAEKEIATNRGWTLV